MLHDAQRTCAERDQRLHEHRGLDGHVQRAGDAGARERLLGGVARAQRHEARHLVLGELDLLAAELGEGEIGDLEVGETALGGGVSGGSHEDSSGMARLGTPLCERSRPGSPGDSLRGPTAIQASAAAIRGARTELRALPGAGL